MRSNASGDAGLNELNRIGERYTKYSKKLAQHAADDSVTEANGLERFLEPINSWAHDDVLRTVRKRRLGHHRFFITGRHTDCSYTLIYVKVNKKEEVDREEDPRFIKKILRALEAGETRTLE